jgi:hypothetical protein
VPSDPIKDGWLDKRSELLSTGVKLTIADAQALITNG